MNNYLKKTVVLILAALLSGGPQVLGQQLDIGSYPDFEQQINIGGSQSIGQQFQPPTDTKEKPTIKVQMLGQVRNPGIYSVQPYERVSSIIAMAGGANEQGSVRRVLLIRKGEVLDSLDIYRYLAYNEQDNNPRVQDGDIIYVPVGQNLIRVVGQVYRPGNYEVKPGESLRDAIIMAGGLTPVATRDDIKIENIAEPGTMKEISYKRLVLAGDSIMDVQLHAGDVVTVPTSPTSVTVLGQVQKGGTFVFEPGRVVSYYLGMASGYGERANRRNIKINHWGGKTQAAREDTSIEPGDVIFVGELQIRDWRDFISITGQLVTMFYIVWTMAK